MQISYFAQEIHLANFHIRLTFFQPSEPVCDAARVCADKQLIEIHS